MKCAIGGEEVFYIKLEDDMSLVITVREPIYRGDNLNQKIRYLLPAKVGDIDILTAYVYLNYIRADGVADVVILERMDEMYNESYYQYAFPVTCKLSKYPGEICTWMQIYTGSLSNPMIAKSSECILQVEDSKNMDDYLCDHQVTAIFQLQKQMEEGGTGGSGGTSGDDSGDTPDWEDMDGAQNEDPTMPDWEDMDSMTGGDSDGDSSWDEMG
ncbi:MAG: hypothetical protein IJ418_16260 [Clostridia bacterium]|nr:hypothetical protein [Clostridia bacterium]